MTVRIGLDLGTTSITAVAVAVAGAEQIARALRDTPSASASAPGRREWHAPGIVDSALGCLAELVANLPGRDFDSLGLTGQQHGVVLIDANRRPLSPFVNWQDRRGEEPFAEGVTFTQEARRRVGDSFARAGCRLATGYMAVTLFRMGHEGGLPAGATACFLADYFASVVTQAPPVVEATHAASSGAFDLARADWDEATLAALGLRRALFPPLRPAGEVVGRLSSEASRVTGLPEGLPVRVALGDNQASFLGAVASPADSVLVNVGTGGQVSAHTPRLIIDERLETRPFPGGGYLLVSAGQAGGAAYATLAGFFRRVGEELYGSTGDIYEAMNRLAEAAPPGCDGLRCRPTFAGTRRQPELQASWDGMTATNFTPGHMARALLEGVVEALAQGAEVLTELRGPASRLVGAGNGVRANPLLGRVVAERFGMPLEVSPWSEEAAMGACVDIGGGAAAIQ